MPSEKRPEEDDSPKPAAKRQRASKANSSTSSKSSNKSSAKGKASATKGKNANGAAAESKTVAKKGKGKAAEPKATASKAKKASPTKKAATETKSKKSPADKKAPTKGKGKTAKAKAGEKEKNVWKPVLCATGLQQVQAAMLDGVLANKKAKLLDDFDHRVTHLLVNAFDVDDTPTRTIKLCKAIAAGIPLVCLKYLEESYNSSTLWPDVKPFIHTLTRAENAPKLFGDMEFFFGSLGTSSDMKMDLMDIVRYGGGKVLSKKPEIPSQPAENEGSDDTAPPTSKLILVEDPAHAEKNSGTAGRRVALSAIRDAIPGAELVEPNWILDKCCAATKKIKETKKKKATKGNGVANEDDNGEMEDEVVPETEEPSEDAEKDRKLTDDDFVADSGGEDFDD